MTMPPELVVVLTAMLPIAEIKVSVPLAMLVYKMKIHEVFFWSVLGNVLPVLVVYGIGGYWLKRVEKRRGFLRRFTDRLVRRTHKHFSRKYDKFGLLSLPLFVALPVPVAGAWTCAIAAFLWKVRFRKAFPLIMLGSELAAILVIILVKASVFTWESLA